MMQMLGFRGSTSEKAKSNEAGTSTAQADSYRPAKALRLVYYDDKGKFRMDAQAVAALQLVKGPLGVVSVCGRARQGKSFILNQLLGRSGGFQVAATHRPCTKGLWMWSAPLKRTAADGTEYNLLLLDSEGIDAYDQTGTYSTQIFSLAVLLSSMFVYNQMGGIDEAALDKLSLVTEMTKHIRVRASQKNSSVDELGQFSPIFVWLLRDFYLELKEDGRRITPKEYLESALQPMAGTGKAVLAKNEIRDSIRALFPDRHCFPLVRPLNEERELQRLDQISLEKMRPEFRLGLDQLTRFVFERTRPKQVGSIVMTGPLLAGLTQSFLDAINAGAVPTISTSWQSVEENECRRAFDMAFDAYKKSIEETLPADEGAIEEIHEAALQNGLNVYGEEAVGTGPVRVKYERSLLAALKKHYEDYKRKMYMEAELKCVKAIDKMEEKLRIAAHSPDASFNQIISLLSQLMSEYERSNAGPTKWRKLAKFLQQSLEGSLHDLVKREKDQTFSRHGSLELRCRSMEDKISLLNKQTDVSQRDAQEWKRRYEAVMADFKSTTEHSSAQHSALQNKISKLEEKSISLSEQLEAAMKEAAEWRNKYDHIATDWKTQKERRGAEFIAVQSKCSALEARLAAAREQSESAKEEAVEWRRKHDTVVTESRAAIEKATLQRDRALKQAQQREDALRAELSSEMDQKNNEVRQVQAKLEESDRRVSSLKSHNKDQEVKLTGQAEEIATLQAEMRHLQKEILNAKNALQHTQRELDSTNQERSHTEARLSATMKQLREVEENCGVLERDAKRAAEEAEKARRAASTVEREKLEAMRLAVERLAQVEKAKRQCEALEREKEEHIQNLERLKQMEREAVGVVASLENRLVEGEHEMEELLNSTREQRDNTVKVLEGLLETERAGRMEANTRADALSVQLQTVQSKLDKLQYELNTLRLSETTAETKYRVYHPESSGRKKRPILEDIEAKDSVEEMDTDISEPTRLCKRTRFDPHPDNGNSPTTPEESNSPSKPEEEQSTDTKDSQDYLKFTIPKLKQELVNKGFAEQLFLLRNPSKKNILSLYEKCILHK